jgi:nitrogen fixation/metabolism regulation signal transduction histidine kinase
MENICNTTKSDITLYTPEGKVFRSTTPEVFERMIMGSRMDESAYYNIRNLHQRYFIHRENIDDYAYWAMYAPIFNDKGQMVAIVGTPYTDRGFDFRREAFFHAALIINLFLLLLIASLLFSTREVNSLFYPLMEMGKKMNVADIHDLEYIIYKREDEISSLVDAYNRMVKGLSESTRQLAQAERDKAWSQMARQVAHEIKNPLTPIKLQIQRLIRLKNNGNPAWEQRFDEVSAVVLEHIDILTETANEFSTFAKLYSEDPVLMDLDRTLKDQIMIFDNRENVKISYLGMENAMVMAPKPQLIRVFVNLITNAVQAVENAQKEAADNGEETRSGRVMISLRNSIKEGYYDIVVEDNGPGVSEENQSKLFTPNFTTKSSGTGLGLAICRNIIEKCEGEIHYQKSFVLGGASFIVTVPKHQL